MIVNMQSGGVVPERIIDAQTITPGTAEQVISAGTYLRGNLTIAGDADLIPANIKEDKNIFGVQGTPGGSGANVWSKCNAAQATCNIKIGAPTGADTTVFPIILTGEESIFKFDDLVGQSFSLTDDTFSYSINIISTTQAEVYRVGDLLGTYTIIYNESAKTFYLNRLSFGTTVRIISNINLTITGLAKTLLKFVVDDDISAYPNGAVHTDGYYYELLAQVTSANAASLSDTALMTVQQDYRDTIETEVSNANA